MGTKDVQKLRGSARKSLRIAPPNGPKAEEKGIHMGVGEEIKGKAKEAVGSVVDDDNLRREGRAQQDKGQAERQATQARAEARAHDAKANLKEAEQRAAESAK